jgi:hypothetical protein
MSANTNPIFSRLGAIDGSANVVTGDSSNTPYTGQGAFITTAFIADPTNGNYIQRLRFKALGTNIATVARVFINNGSSPKAPIIAAVTGTPTGTPSASGGTLSSGNFYAKVYAVDQYGSVTAASTETAAVVVSGPTGSITWNWTAVTGAASYIITVGLLPGQEQAKFTSTTNSYTQTTPGTNFAGDVTINNYFFGEISLPATTASNSSATPEVDYPMNFALPPGFSILVGLGTSVASGWSVTTIGGVY